MRRQPSPLLLCILDGWGHSDAVEGNAIHAAATPAWDRLWRACPHTLIETSGAAVGLPPGQMGNSEVGHLTLGAGRVIRQEQTRISEAVRNGAFFANPALVAPLDAAARAGRAVHLLGLLSPGGVHSHERHIHALVELAARRGVSRLYLHAFLDGRDTPPQSALGSIQAMEERFAALRCGRFASVTGRYYAMDRDSRWERIASAYAAIAHGQAPFQAPDALTALERAYARGETDEFVQATAILSDDDAAPVSIAEGDALFFMNYRADRARQLTEALTQTPFVGFARGAPPRFGAFITLTEYKSSYGLPAAYPPRRLVNGLGETVARYGLRQLRIAETEKYAHVTFFFNGGEERPFVGEERILIPSPRVASYDLQPQMSAVELTDQLTEAIRVGAYDVIVCNYANADMVGHTGNFAAAVRAVETLDACLGRLREALEERGGEMLITADHGNSEQMYALADGAAEASDADGGPPHTAHTCNPVPLVYLGRAATLAPGGTLADIAPTLLHLLGLAPPAEMEGRSLATLC